MPKTARWLSLVLLPIAAFFDAAAYYGARSVIYVHVLEAAGDVEAIGVAMMGAAFASLFGTLVAGGIGLTKRPLLGAAAGAGFVVLAAGLLALLPADAAMLGMAVLGLGHGLVRTSVLGAAVSAFGDFRTEPLRNAAVVGVYGAANFAAASASGAAWLAEEASARAVFVAAVVVAVPALVVALGLDAASFWGDREADALSEPPARKGSAHLVVIGLVLLLGGVVQATWSGGLALVFELAEAAPGGLAERAWLMSLNPIVVGVACLLAFGASVGAHFAKVRVPTLAVIGTGMLMMSAAFVALLGASDADAGVVVPAVVLLSVGEVLVAPLLLSRIAGDVPERLHTMAIALFYAFTTTPMLMLNAIGQTLDLTRQMAAIAAGLAGLVGLLFLVGAFLTKKILYPDPAEPTEF